MNIYQPDPLGSDAMAAWGEYGLPDYMLHGMREWLLRGLEPGDFLSAVLRNDLKLAVMYADDNNLNKLPQYVSWLYNWAPSDCWGSKAKFQSWDGLESKR